jgi:thiamine biosynthesis lipoprotein
MISRRRFLTIAAAAAVATPSRAASIAEWHGRAMGAAARIVLTGTGHRSARRLFRRVEHLLIHLETQFSLHADSGLARLNRDGRWAYPDHQVLALFRLAGQVHAATDGAFDPTVQPLWQAIATGGDIATAGRLVGWQDVDISDKRIRLARPGMALTFNGIAQGYAADRVAALLRQEGFTDVLLDMGEINAIGERPGGGAWRAAIVLPDGRSVGEAGLINKALAVSSPAGTLIGPGAAHSHILNPKGNGPRWQICAVTAPSAALADALSTGFCVMEQTAIAAALKIFPEAKIVALS